MDPALDTLLVLVVLLDFQMLGSSRTVSVIRAAAMQGVLLGMLPILAHPGLSLEKIVICVGAIGLKGVLIPRLLLRAVRDSEVHREVEPIIGFTASLLLGALGTGLSILLARSLPLIEAHRDTFIVPASFATVFTGFLILTTRRKSISQVVGYLALENGIFIFGVLLLEAMPFLVEIGVLLDLFVAIFVMGILLHHIRRTFSSVDSSQLSTLRE